jgi:hypothetical protein
MADDDRAVVGLAAFHSRRSGIRRSSRVNVDCANTRTAKLITSARTVRKKKSGGRSMAEVRAGFSVAADD